MQRGGRDGKKEWRWMRVITHIWKHVDELTPGVRMKARALSRSPALRLQLHLELVGKVRAMFWPLSSIACVLLQL